MQFSVARKPSTSGNSDTTTGTCAVGGQLNFRTYFCAVFSTNGAPATFEQRPGPTVAEDRPHIAALRSSFL